MFVQSDGDATHFVTKLYRCNITCFPCGDEGRVRLITSLVRGCCEIRARDTIYAYNIYATGRELEMKLYPHVSPM